MCFCIMCWIFVGVCFVMMCFILGGLINFCDFNLGLVWVLISKVLLNDIFVKDLCVLKCGWVGVVEFVFEGVDMWDIVFIKVVMFVNRFWLWFGLL